MPCLSPCAAVRVVMRCDGGKVFTTESSVALATLRAEGSWAYGSRPNVLELVPAESLAGSVAREASSGHGRRSSKATGAFARRSSGTEAGVVAAGVALLAAVAAASATCAPAPAASVRARETARRSAVPVSPKSAEATGAEAEPPSPPHLAPCSQPQTPATMVLTPGNAVVQLSTRRTPRLPSPLEGCDTTRRRTGSDHSAAGSECSGSALWSESPVSVRSAKRQRSSSTCRAGFRRRAGFVHTVSPVPAWAMRFE